jgi:hypothetical protein
VKVGHDFASLPGDHGLSLAVAFVDVVDVVDAEQISNIFYCFVE